MTNARKLGSVQQQFVGARGIAGGNVLVLGSAEASLLPRASDQYCAILDVKPINYLLLAPDEQDAIIVGFRSLINSVSFPWQILTRITPLDVQPYLDQLQGRVDQARAQPGTVAAPLLAELTEENIGFVQQLATRRRLLERHFYLVIPAQAAEEQSLQAVLWSRVQASLGVLRRRPAREYVLQFARQQGIARSQLDLRVSQMQKLLAKVGLEARRVQGVALAQLYASCLVPHHAHQAPLSAEILASLDRPTQARAPRSWAPHRATRPIADGMPDDVTVATTAAPSTDAALGIPYLTLRDVLAPSSAEVTPQAVQLDGEWSRTLVVVGYPRHVYPGWIPHLITTDVPLDLAIHINPIEASGMIRRLTRQMAEYRSSELLDTRQGRMPDAERTVAYQDVERLRDQLQRGEERIFGVSLYLTMRAPSLRALDEYTAQVRTVLDNLQLLAHSAVYEQDLGLLSCLPEARDRLKRPRLLDSSSVATAFPFASSTLSMTQGILYGVASDGGLIILDPFSAELENANQVVFAKSGAGKSYACKLQALRMLMLGYSVYVIDPENEWRVPCEAAGGTTMRIAPGSDQHMNPFDLPIAVAHPQAEWEQRDPLAEHVLIVLSLLDLMLADHTVGQAAALTQREKSYLEKAIYETYRRGDYR